MKDTMWTTLTAALCLLEAVGALPQTQTASGVSTGVPSLTLSTVVASPTVSLSDGLPSQIPLPPKQDWCPSEIFCAGEVRQDIYPEPCLIAHP